MAPLAASPLESLAACLRRLGLRVQQQSDGSLRLPPDWPTQPELRIEAGPLTDWSGLGLLRWDGCRLTPEATPAPLPAAALILAHHLEALRQTGQPPAPASSPADLALELFDLGTVFSEVFDELLAFLFLLGEREKKKAANNLTNDREAFQALDTAARRHGLPDEGLALAGWLVVAGFFRRSRADQREVLERVATARRAEACPPALEAWLDAAWLLARDLAAGGSIALHSSQPELWQVRRAFLALELQVAAEPAAAMLHLLDCRGAAQPLPLTRLPVPAEGWLLALLPRHWWTAAGFHRWRQQLARRFDLVLALDDPETDFRLAVLRPRAAGTGAGALLVRFHRPLAELLPPDRPTASPHRRLDRLQALLETARQPPATYSSRYRSGEWEVVEEQRPSLRVRRLTERAEPTVWAQAQALPSWWLELLGYGRWLVAEGCIDFRSRNLRGWAAAWALGPRWPAEPDLHRAEAAPRTVAGWLVAREARWCPWLESSFFWRLCRLAQREGLPWTSVVRLPEAMDWPASAGDLRGAALDAAVIEALAGDAANSLWTRIADEDSSSPNRSDPAYDAFARAARPLLPPRPLAEALYCPRSPRDPPDYASLDLLRLPRPDGPMYWDYFLGQYSWCDAQGRRLWQGSSWAQGAWLGVQTPGEGPLTCPREADLAAELVECYRQVRERLRRALRRLAFARGSSPELAGQWAERLLASQFGPPLVPDFGHTD